MEVLLVVHGFVQGVGYRAFVKGIAMRYSVNGYVRNLSDGSVEIYAEAEESTLKLFEDDIKIDEKHGPVVMSVEKFKKGHERFPNVYVKGKGFVIVH